MRSSRAWRGRGYGRQVVNGVPHRICGGRMACISYGYDDTSPYARNCALAGAPPISTSGPLTTKRAFRGNHGRPCAAGTLAMTKHPYLLEMPSGRENRCLRLGPGGIRSLSNRSHLLPTETACQKRHSETLHAALERTASAGFSQERMANND